VFTTIPISFLNRKIYFIISIINFERILRDGIWLFLPISQLNVFSKKEVVFGTRRLLEFCPRACGKVLQG